MAKRTPDELAYIAHEELKVPVSIYFERRRNTRISIGSDSVHLRLPKNLSKKEFEDQLAWAEKWLHRRLEKAPVLLERFKSIFFRHGDRLRIMSDVYVLHITMHDQKTAKATLKNQDIFIGLSAEIDVAERNKSIQSLTHKLLCKRYLVFMKQRVRTLNEKYFRQPYGRVQVKYIQSKWGSCSSNGDIVLSSKLLLCPLWILDYIIVHELAHLIEHNHSSAFWDLVAEALPDYEKAEKWLNEEGAGLEIKPIHQSQPPRYHSDLIELPAKRQMEPIQKAKNITEKEPGESDPAKSTLPMVEKTNLDSGTNDEAPPQFVIPPDASEEKITSQSTLFPDYNPSAATPIKKNRKKKSRKQTVSDSSEQLSLF